MKSNPSPRSWILDALRSGTVELRFALTSSLGHPLHLRAIFDAQALSYNIDFRNSRHWQKEQNCSVVIITQSQLKSANKQISYISLYLPPRCRVIFDDKYRCCPLLNLTSVKGLISFHGSRLALRVSSAEDKLKLVCSVESRMSFPNW